MKTVDIMIVCSTVLKLTFYNRYVVQFMKSYFYGTKCTANHKNSFCLTRFWRFYNKIMFQILRIKKDCQHIFRFYIDIFKCCMLCLLASYDLDVQGVHKVLHTFKILISQKPHKVETLNFRQ